MTTPNKALIRKVRRKLRGLGELNASHCGHESLLREVFDAEDVFLEWLGNEVEKCERSAVIADNNLNRGPG